jgi:putative nucleotidyltransferase with HDIG domain
LNRDEALVELKARISNIDLINHSLAVEAIMRETALFFKEDTEVWGLAGLLHDIDYEKTKNEPENHSIIGAEIIENMGIDSSIVYAVKAHNSIHGIKRKRKMDKILYSSAPLADLIIEAAKKIDSKKMDDLDTDYILSKFNEKSFARDVDRVQIKECEEVGYTIEKFIEISLTAIKKVAKNLEL